MEIIERWIIQQTGRSLDTFRPHPLSPFEAIEILWPLNDIFRPHMDRLKTVSYKHRAEKLADDAIEAFAYKPDPETWSNITVNTWRVLLERHNQWIIVCCANKFEGRGRISYIPEGLADHLRLPCMMLAMMYQMELPLPVDDKSLPELPEGPFDPSLVLH